MTNEEAIRMLVRLKERINFEVTDAQKKMDALNLAIEALEQQPRDNNWKFYYDHGYAQAKRDLLCEDCISRADVLALAEKGTLVSNGNYKSVCKAINDLPSVQPTIPKGKWIGEESLDGSIRYMCDNCKEFEYVDYYDFCPNCGADMRESDKE